MPSPSLGRERASAVFESNVFASMMSGVRWMNIPPPPPSPAEVQFLNEAETSVALVLATTERPPPFPESAALLVKSLEVMLTHPPSSTAIPPPAPPRATLPATRRLSASSSVLRPRNAPPPAADAQLFSIFTFVRVRNVSRSVELPGSSVT